MKVELSEDEIKNLIAFIAEYPAKGQAQEVSALLKQKLAQALQPNKDGAKPAEEIPEDKPIT